MNSRELVINSLSYKQTVKLPVDFGSTAVTGLHVAAIAALRNHYGLEKRPVKVIEPYQMLGEVDDELKEVMEVDTAGVIPEKNMFGFKNENWKEWKFPVTGLNVLVPGDFKYTTNSDGDILIYPEGDLSVSPSARMPKDGYFFDTIIRQKPLSEGNLKVEDNLEEFKEFTEEDINYFEKEVLAAYKSGRAVIASFGGTAIGDIALIPAPFMKNPKGIRDIEEWYVSTLIRQDYVHSIFEKQTDIVIRNLNRLNIRFGKYVDVVFTCGTDFGTQNSTFCSPDTFRNLYMPYYKKLNDWIHRNTKWKIFKHSCGAIKDFIPLFIESGFDILNPVQISAANMDPVKLKEEYGDRIVYWGGGVNTQKPLEFSTPREVFEEVKRNIDVFFRNGGFVFNAVHNIQGNTPIENIVAMIEAIKEYR